MTVENTTNKKRFNGDGVTDTVTANIRVLSVDDLKVYVYPEDLDFDDLEDYLLDPTDYTATIAEDGESVEIVFDTTPTSDEIGLILNDPALTQTADLPTEGNFNEASVEAALDRVVLQNIKQQEKINRGIFIGKEDPLATETFEGLEIAADTAINRAGRALVFNVDGDGLETGPDASDIVSAQTYAEQTLTYKNDAEAAKVAAEAAAASITLPVPVTSGGTGAASAAVARTNLGLGSAAVENTSAFATAAQGTKADTAVQPANGQILQVLSTTKTDTFSHGTSTFTDVTGLSQAITPADNTNKVLVMATISIGVNTGVDNACFIKLLRDSTEIGNGASDGSNRVECITSSTPFNPNAIQTFTLTYLDSPASASSVTYKIQIAASNAGDVYVNRSHNDTDATSIARCSSTITVMEVRA